MLYLDLHSLNKEHISAREFFDTEKQKGNTYLEKPVMDMIKEVRILRRVNKKTSGVVYDIPMYAPLFKLQ